MEDVTPKGGDLLKRTIENFQPPPPKKANMSIERTNTPSGDEAGNAPNEEKMDIGDPTDAGAGGVRTMRGENAHG